MREFDLQKLMDGLYENLDYFASIEPESSNYEEEYHNITIDPDGKREIFRRKRTISCFNE